MTKDEENRFFDLQDKIIEVLKSHSLRIKELEEQVAVLVAAHTESMEHL